MSPISSGPQTFLVTKKFGLQEIWSLRNLGPQILVPAWICYIMSFMRGLTSSGPKFLGDQKCQGPKWDQGSFQLQPKTSKASPNNDFDYLEFLNNKVSTFYCWLYFLTSIVQILDFLNFFGSKAKTDSKHFSISTYLLSTPNHLLWFCSCFDASLYDPSYFWDTPCVLAPLRILFSSQNASGHLLAIKKGKWNTVKFNSKL